MKCPYCEKQPNQLDEYISPSQVLNITPDEFVRMEEGTYHRATDLFCCTVCYVKIGTPLKKDLHDAFKLYRKERGHDDNSKATPKLNVHKYNIVDFLSRSYSNVEEDIEIFKVIKHLPELIKDKMWIAGGAIRRTLLNKELDTDVDLFFKDEESLKSYSKELEKIGAKIITENEHQTTFTYHIEKLNKSYLIQAVTISFYDNVEDLLDSFDFTITQFAFDGEILYCGEHSIWDLKSNKLALHKLTYGVATMRRMIKYTNQGFTACAGTMASILEATVANPGVIQSDIEYID